MFDITTAIMNLEKMKKETKRKRWVQTGMTVGLVGRS
jgi:hypothetical protein